MNFSDGSGIPVRRLLLKTVQIYEVLATPQLCYLEEKHLEHLEDLDCIFQCIPYSVGDARFSTLIEKLGVCDANDRDGIIQEATSLAEKAVKFLTNRFCIEFDSKSFQLLGGGGTILLVGGLFALPCVGIYALAGGLYASAAAGAATCAAGGGAASLTLADYLEKGITIEAYRKVLKIAIEEASLWPRVGQSPPKGPINVNEDVMTEAKLESLLLKEVERSGSYWPEMMKRTLDESRDIALQSKILQGATLDTKRNLLRRMQIVAKTSSAYNRDLSESKFVGIVGAEDAGKSTLIKRAIEQYGRKDDENLQKNLPKVGLALHTTVVRPYKLKDKLWLVDFPGSNGTERYADAWKLFTALPSSCILLLDFKDRIKEPQRQMYENMKKDLVPDGEDSKITVVFNKVDKRFSRHTEELYNAEYFNEQRETAARLLGCKAGDVYFACLNPYPEEKLTTLRNYGVLGFEELAERVLCLSE